MKSQVFKNFDLTILPTIGMILFLTIFIGMIFWIYRKDSKDIYKELSQMPLDEGKSNE